MTNIKLNTIDLQAPTQLRQTKESQKHIIDLAFSYAEEGSFKEAPWVGRLKDTGALVPIDGFHRLHAIDWLSSDEYKSFPDAVDVSHLDLSNVEVRLTDFENLSEAIIAAAGVNATHGLKRKLGDISHAISAILDVDPTRFMLNSYKLDKKAIMSTVNCSSRTYEVETKVIRDDLVKQRNFDIRALHEEGKSLREIEEILNVSKSVISRVVVPETQSAQMGQEESLSVPETQSAQMGQEEPSILSHVTAAEEVSDPWEDDTPEEPLHTPSSLDTLINMFKALDMKTQEHALNILNDMSLDF